MSTFQTPPNQPPFDGSVTRPKKSYRGCWIALGIVGFLIVVGVMILGIIFYNLSQNPDVQRITRAMGQGYEVYREATRGPGTAEIRALGCNQAMVMSMDRLVKIAQELDDTAPETPPSDAPSKILVCQILQGSSGPSCEMVARTYLRAVPQPGGDIAVMVQFAQDQMSGCSKVYNPLGQEIRAFDQSTAPAIPQSGGYPTP